MRNFILLLTFWCCFQPFSFGQQILNQRVKFDYQDQPLQSILEDVEKRYSVFFTYANLNLSKKINFKYQGRLRAGLYELLSPQNIAFKLIGDNIVLKYSPPILQNIKGQVLDNDSQVPLIGANIFILNSDPLVGTSVDEKGYFILPKIPIGRYDLEVQYIGYETTLISQVLLIAGKETFLNIQMKESVASMPEIVVTANLNRKVNAPLNDMSSVSARSFSVEETQRYAAAISDPARMVQSFAGVSNGGDDLSNELIIRGNNSRGLLWRLEGVDIPSPNHFGDYVSGGGAISMLSSNMLANSDFFTGAFPAEYGNALSGVFDLKLRNGNSDQREHSVSFSTLGLEASTEGYFSKKSKASYLINYRYSTLKVLDNFLLEIGDLVPSYQDISFKINIPNEKHHFSFFGIGGKNALVQVTSRDSLDWTDLDSEFDQKELQEIGILGVTHKAFFSEKTYLQSSLMAAAHLYNDCVEKVYHNDLFPKTFLDGADYKTFDFRATTNLHHKFNAKNQIRTGASVKYERFFFDFVTWIPDSLDFIITPATDSSLITFHDSKGDSYLYQSYFQWKNRFHPKWKFNAGFHFSFFSLNNTFIIDPRASLSWDFRKNQTISIATGIHSKPEHTSTYFIQNTNPEPVNPFPNLSLTMPRAFHLVGSYEYFFKKDWRVNIEGYYQYLYSIPVSSNPESAFSIANASNVFNFIFSNELGEYNLVSEGKVFNYGIDFTLEKRFGDDYYFLLTSSIFESKYTTRNGRKFNSKNANNFLLNVLAGKEWKFSNNSKSLFGINAKYTFYGGNRVTPIDLEASIEADQEVLVQNSYFEMRLDPYIRFDFGINYKLNRKLSTHTISLDFQNLTNRMNVINEFYNRQKQVIQDEFQNGLIPFITYKIEFRMKPSKK